MKPRLANGLNQAFNSVGVNGKKLPLLVLLCAMPLSSFWMNPLVLSMHKRNTNYSPVFAISLKAKHQSISAIVLAPYVVPIVFLSLNRDKSLKVAPIAN